ncbi:MAG: hypothetical protein ACRDI2_23150 [Chloroflexota bacterium]
MSTQVTVTLPDDVYQSAERLAQLTRRGVPDVLADALTLSLPVLRQDPNVAPPIETLSDEEVLVLSTLELPPEQDRRLGALLDGQQAGALTDIERTELVTLMQVYQEGLLRKAQALHEAVRRGLREPLAP